MGRDTVMGAESMASIDVTEGGGILGWVPAGT